ncbi:MAG: 8, gp08 [Frankiales bacterium]|nr:8, gp08 [Frankiales bacterium]
MKALTVRQPWAWAIATGAKTVENRTRGTAYRGPLAIHAGLGWSDRGAHDARVAEALVLHRARDIVVPNRAAATALRDSIRRLRNKGVRKHDPVIALGAVIAVAQLVDSHPDTGCCRPWGESSYEEAGGRTRTVLHHLVLEDVRVLAVPIPARGALGLWAIPPDVLEQLQAAA